MEQSNGNTWSTGTPCSIPLPSPRGDVHWPPGHFPTSYLDGLCLDLRRAHGSQSDWSRLPGWRPVWGTVWGTTNARIVNLCEPCSSLDSWGFWPCLARDPCCYIRFPSTRNQSVLACFCMIARSQLRSHFPKPKRLARS